MLYGIVKGVLGIFCFMAVWIAVQSYIRKRMELAAGFDVLEDMTHGCGNCGHGESCGGADHCDELSVTERQL